jgi:uncharacterized protein (DUF1330 family)
MAKGYWVVVYHSISEPDRLLQYSKAAGPVIEAGGGRYLVRGAATKAVEKGILQRVVIAEFESVQQAIKVYESDAYQAAVKIMEGAVERDVRFVEGLA